MYMILADGQAKGLCEKPNYVKNKDGIWIDGTKENHDAIAIGGVAYEGAVAKEIDGGEYTFQIDQKTETNTVGVKENSNVITELEISNAETENAIIDLEIALAELQPKGGI